MRRSLPDSIVAEKVIPVARGLNGSTAPGVARALLEGGISTIEVTVEGDGGIEAIESLRDIGIVVGAGTVTSTDQAGAAVGAGAAFLVSPHLDRVLLDWAGHHDIALIPGGLTPTEVAEAWALGTPAVKLFPASVGGPEYLRSLLGPFPDLRLIPTGGVEADNIVDYLEAGAVAVGVGSWLTSHRDRAEVTTRAAQLRSKVV
ncbi:MAG: bifunctional 4-hydroxy-2-oxoglutarate aldolase/2-dehydro-3-deoxy-phosphogluconate aldolase [Acidimicrobiia bacterium]